ncbi:MAG: hypothetical protein EAZ55_03400 [Cytophagales bacterium]|nr:MAG: hypothetical protein EAZ55_03400 [Cytophagales bacterium]
MINRLKKIFTNRLNTYQTLSPWQKLYATTKYMRRVAIGLLLSFMIGLCIILGVAYQLSLALALWITPFWLLIWSVFLVIFIKNRWEGNRLYQKFMLEVESRMLEGKSIQIPTDKSRILNNYLLYSDLQIFKITLIVAGLVFSWYIMPSEIRVLFLKKPEPLHITLQKSIIRKQETLKQTQQNIERTQKAISQLERSNQQCLQRIEQLRISIGSHYGSITEIQGFRYKSINIAQQLQQTQQNPTTQQIEQEYRTFEEIKGQIKINLEIAGTEVNQAEQLIFQNTSVIKACQDLTQRYDYLLKTGQEASYRDYVEWRKLDEQIVKNNKAIVKMKTALQNDSTWAEQLKIFLKKDAELLAKIGKNAEIKPNK